MSLSFLFKLMFEPQIYNGVLSKLAGLSRYSYHSPRYSSNSGEMYY